MPSALHVQSAPAALGDLLRHWRQRRGLSQLALALECEISQRHLSFVESGRSRPSREMVLRLAEQLGVPLRERNQMLLAAGFAPVYAERALTDPAMRAAREAVERVLSAHEPYPAIAIDRHWNLVAHNRAIAPLLDGVAPALLAPPINVMRLSLHPEGLASRIANLAQWRAHLLDRLQQQCTTSRDPILLALLDEMRALPEPATGAPHVPAIGTEGAGVFVALQLTTPVGVMSFLSTTTVFGTPVEVTLSELALECLFPADAFTAAALRAVPLE